jgi:predicted nucleotidyltransferase
MLTNTQFFPLRKLILSGILTGRIEKEQVLMTRQEAMKYLLAQQEELHALGVKTLALFGSVARGDAVNTSDVDVVVELNRPMGLFGLSVLKNRIQEILGVSQVDLITRDNIHPALKDVILKELVDVI